MLEIREYDPSMQPDVERVYGSYMSDLGIDYEPGGRHKDIVDIPRNYLAAGAFWCLFDEAELVGMVAVRALDGDHSAAEIKRLYVLPAYHGLGYGQAMFTRALRFLKQEGYGRALLDTRRDLVAARRLYDKFGFIETGRYNDNHHAELFFERDLASLELPPRSVFFPARTPPRPDFVVIASVYEGRWIFVRRFDRDTYEMPGGHIEAGERPMEAARRELYEETGATHQILSFVAGYGVARDTAVSSGMLYMAEVSHLGRLPDFEIAERILSDTEPDRMTYPDIQPALLAKAKAWLLAQQVRMLEGV
jgi:8-oxo-dGTP diphosphatase